MEKEVTESPVTSKVTTSRARLCAPPCALPLSVLCRSPSCRLLTTLADKDSAKYPALRDMLICNGLQDTLNRLFGDLCFTGLHIPHVKMSILLCSLHLGTMACLLPTRPPLLSPKHAAQLKLHDSSIATENCLIYH